MKNVLTLITKLTWQTTSILLRSLIVYCELASSRIPLLWAATHLLWLLFHRYLLGFSHIRSHIYYIPENNIVWWSTYIYIYSLLDLYILLNSKNFLLMGSLEVRIKQNLMAYGKSFGNYNKIVFPLSWWVVFLTISLEASKNK